jgi:hypothetical protein
MNPAKSLRHHVKFSLPAAAAVFLLVFFVAQIQQTEAQQASEIFPQSPLRVPIPANAVYTADTRFGSFRSGYQEWDCPVYRVPVTENNPLVRISNPYGRVENWPIPRYAQPAPEEDGHMCVFNPRTGMIYEFYQARWTGTTTMSAGGMVAFPINSTGVSNPPNFRVTASGFSNTIGMVKREDFINPATGQIDVNNAVIRHALTMAIPWGLLGKNAYIAPAVGGEIMGYGTVNPIPMGARFALPRNLNVDALNVDPVVKAILRAARDYGIYISDGSGTANYGGKYAGAIEVEPNLLPVLYGRGTSNNEFASVIQQQVYSVIQQYGFYRVTGFAVATPTPGTGMTSTPIAPATSTPRPTNTATPRPTNTATPRPTNTATPRPTNTATPRPTNTATPRPTNTVVPRISSTPGPSSTPTPRLTATPQPSSTPIVINPSGLGARIVAPASVDRNNPFDVSIMLDNPILAAGGGVDAAQVECVLAPESHLRGQNVTAGNIFGPNAAVVSRNFPWSDWMLFAISQTGSNPPVTQGGNVVTMRINPARRGTATISCFVDLITASGSPMSLAVAPVSVSINR